ncbi:Mpv17 / PMP22 family protein [Nitzschia inconspicua]|uniref:Mpv17 / PMP22 family protein n=1 Tax=Nitzschia inconspicua TaxID=303405 RepID=A0A9K3KFN6_9STRA|nr:Mpv17 / PMP22 family protein [Nitzschia inconspicua]
MAPAVPEPLSLRPPLHHHFDIVDDESLQLIVADDSPEKTKTKYHYCSFDDTVSTSVMSSYGELSDEDATVMAPETETTTASALEPYTPPPCYKRLWNAYYNNLQQNPLVVKSITAFILLLLADLMAQGVEHLRGISEIRHGQEDAILLPVNLLRSLRFGVFGFLGAPWTHYYYHWLDTVLPPTSNPWTWTTFVKVAVDQGIQAPAMLGLIISGLAFMEGRGWNGIANDMQQQYAEALIQNWKLWIPATVINIAFVQPALRVLYDNLVFFIWTIYLSMILNEVQP